MDEPFTIQILKVETSSHIGHTAFNVKYRLGTAGMWRDMPVQGPDRAYAAARVVEVEMWSWLAAQQRKYPNGIMS